MTERSKTDKAKINDPLIGKKIGEDFEILDLIGIGGMSTVYKIKRLSDRKELAGKTLRNPDSISTKRFEHEVKIHTKLKHENIVEAIDCITDPYTDQSFFLMEYIEGYSLSQLLNETGYFKEDRALINFFRQISAALSYSHSEGVLHRDIKPGNIFMLFNEDDNENPFTVKMIDFGLAKVETEMQRITKTGMVIGSPTYMSPEQCMGRKLDSRADVYSLGALLFTLTTGDVPYKDKDVIKVFEKHCDPNIRPASISTHNKDLNALNQLDTIIQTAMQTDPRKRFNTVGEMLNAFEFWYECVESGSYEKKLDPEDFIKEENIPESEIDSEDAYQDELVALLKLIQSPKKSSKTAENEKVEQVDELNQNVKTERHKEKHQQSVFIKSKKESGARPQVDSERQEIEEEVIASGEHKSNTSDADFGTIASKVEENFDKAALNRIGVSKPLEQADSQSQNDVETYDSNLRYSHSSYTESTTDATTSMVSIMFLIIGLLALVAGGFFFYSQINTPSEEDLNNPAKFHKPPPANSTKKAKPESNKNAGKIPNLSGAWSSDFGPVEIKQKGRIITGTWSAQNQGTGTFRGKYNPQTSILKVSYFQPWDKATGNAQFKYDFDTKTLRGRWTHISGEVGTWTLLR